MLYVDIRKGCEEYHRIGHNFDSAYSEYFKNKNHDMFNQPITLTHQETYRLVEFLNRFLCRMDYKYVPDLQFVLKAALPLLNFLDSSKTILDIDFNGDMESVKVDNRQMKVFELIQLVYWNLIKCPDASDTVVSKILHTTNPELFVMWDDNIKKKYAYRAGYTSDYSRRKYGAKIYVTVFLPKMQEIARDAVGHIKKIQKEKLDDADAIQLMKSCLHDSAFKSLKDKNCLPGLAKILDEYNYMKYTKNHPKLAD